MSSRPCEFTADRRVSTVKIKTYSELLTFSTFEDRYEYLRLNGSVGEETFGFDRYFNQKFYRSKEWKNAKDKIVIRDHGCDLGIDGYEIWGKIYIHHMNPITLQDLENQSDFLLNPEYLICTTLSTHNAIHYGDKSLLPQEMVERQPNDTCPWKQIIR